MSLAPVVSVVMATYNHAPYVAQTIRSVLDQTFQDLELIVADDGSRDATREVVAGFSDPRLSFFPNTVNRGACVVTNELIGRARGKYVAVINSDDFWVLDKLATQVAFMDSHPEYGAMFGRARFVDREGTEIPPGDPRYAEVFNQPNRSQAAWLRHLFQKGNCLCHPTILIRRHCYDEIGLLDNRYRQIPDLDLWVRLCKRYPIFVSDQVLINFRVLPGENASDPNRNNQVRTLNEYFFVMQGFFDGVSPDILTSGFLDLLHNKTIPTERHVEVERVLLLFADVPHMGHACKIAGLEKLRAMLADPEYRDLLLREYGMDDRYFQKLMAEADAFRTETGPIEVPVFIEVAPDTQVFLRSLSGAMVLGDLKRRLMARVGRKTE